MALLATPSTPRRFQMPEERAPFPSRNFQHGSSAEAACAELRRVATALHVTLPPGHLCEDLHAAVERAAQRSADSMTALRVAVEQFTVALRDDGLKAEGVLISLKSVINNRAFPVIRPYAGDRDDDDLRQQISTWSIEEFYREL